MPGLQLTPPPAPASLQAELKSKKASESLRRAVEKYNAARADFEQRMLDSAMVGVGGAGVQGTAGRGERQGRCPRGSGQTMALTPPFPHHLPSGSRRSRSLICGT